MIAVAEWRPATVTAGLLSFYCRRLPEHPAKLRIVRILCRLFWKHGMIVHSNLGALHIDPLDAIGSFILREGGYEKESVGLAVRLMQSGGVFVDVGANIGLFTIAVSSVTAARCIAVDASAIATARLLSNVRLNRRENVSVFNLACSPEPMVRLATVQDQNLGSTRVVNDTSNGGFGQWVGCAKLTEVLAAARVTERIQMLKADVEGYEVRVFDTFDFGGPLRPRNLIVECDEEGFSSAASTFRYLLNKGYQAHTVNGTPVSSPDQLIEHNVWFRDPAD